MYSGSTYSSGAKQRHLPIGLTPALRIVALSLLLVGGSGAALAEEIKGDAAAAEAKSSMCVGCHEIGGYRTAFPTVYHVPKILNQSEAYIAAALKAYRSGERSHPSMRGIAASLSDQDIADLAAYYAQGAKP